VDSDVDHPGLRALSAATLVTLLPSMALADTPIPTPRLRVEPWLVILLALCAVGYVRGVAKLWRKAGLGRGIRIADAVDSHVVGGRWSRRSCRRSTNSQRGPFQSI
jgi:hypothetical protein